MPLPKVARPEIEAVPVAVIVPAVRLPIDVVALTVPPVNWMSVEVAFAAMPPQVVGVNGKAEPVIVLQPNVPAFQVSALAPAVLQVESPAPEKVEVAMRFPAVRVPETRP